MAPRRSARGPKPRLLPEAAAAPSAVATDEATKRAARARVDALMPQYRFSAESILRSRSAAAVEVPATESGAAGLFALPPTPGLQKESELEAMDAACQKLLGEGGIRAFVAREKDKQAVRCRATSSFPARILS